MKTLVPHSRPSVGAAERAAVMRVLASGRLAEGPEVLALEHDLSACVGHGFGVAVSSGTAAIYLTLRAMKIGEGDRVVIPSYVCTALLNAVLMSGAEPVLADVDPTDGNLTVDTVKSALRRRVRAVVVPHLFGTPAPAADIEALGAPVIEDCAQCVGAHREGRAVGGLTAASVFSFYATKVLCAGEGGMVATSDRRLAQRVRDLREYDNRDDHALRFNFKLTDMQAAIARVQLRRLPDMIRRRRAAADRYGRVLARTGVALPCIDESCEPMFYRYVVGVSRGAAGLVRRARGKGIALSRPVYRPLHRYVGRSGFTGTDRIYRRAVSLPIYPDIGRAEQQAVVDTLCGLVAGQR